MDVSTMEAARSPSRNTTICESLNDQHGLLQMQMFLASLASIITSFVLKPLRLPVIISHVTAGVLLGPSFIGRSKAFLDKFFPDKSLPAITVCADLGLIFEIFLVGVQIAPWTIIKVGRKAIIIGTSVILVPLALSITCGIIIENLRVDYTDFLIVGAVESMTAFPVIASYLCEFNILNSELSRVAFSTSLICGLLSLFLISGFYIFFHKATIDVIVMVGVDALVLVVVIFLLRPVLRWMISHTPQGHLVKQGYLCTVFVIVLVLTFISSYGGMSMFFGPFIFGMIVPSGRPLGSALVKRLEFFNTWVLMPIFYIKHGLRVCIFDIDLKHALLVQAVVLISCTGKFLGAFLPALYYHMSYKDATLLGLTVNAQGLVEIVLFDFLSNVQMIDHESVEVMGLSILLVTGAVTPLVKRLYKSTMECNLNNRRTIQHCSPDVELRVLASIYNKENVSSVIHLLKAINPTKHRPIIVSAVHFVELAGNAVPAVISHKEHRRLSASTASSRHIMNRIRRYEENNRGRISVHPFTVISSYASMHNDVCMLALQEWTSLIVLPYHNNYLTGNRNRGIRTLNCKVLERAPCSVGILVDRGLLGGNKFIFENWSSYRVAVVFFGGADDREALALGAKMSGHPTIELTVIQFLTGSNINSDTVELDDEMISEFKLRTKPNNGVTYIEEQVEDSSRVIRVIEEMNDRYECILLGRRSDQNSALVIELTQCHTCSELGTMGDIFLASGYGGNATILVIQQHTKVARRTRFSCVDADLMQARC